MRAATLLPLLLLLDGLGKEDEKKKKNARLRDDLRGLKLTDSLLPRSIVLPLAPPPLFPYHSRVIKSPIVYVIITYPQAYSAPIPLNSAVHFFFTSHLSSPTSYRFDLLSTIFIFFLFLSISFFVFLFFFFVFRTRRKIHCRGIYYPRYIMYKICQRDRCTVVNGIYVPGLPSRGRRWCASCVERESVKNKMRRDERRREEEEKGVSDWAQVLRTSRS